MIAGIVIASMIWVFFTLMFYMAKDCIMIPLFSLALYGIMLVFIKNSGVLNG